MNEAPRIMAEDDPHRRATSLQSRYDEHYYEHYHSASGLPYERAEPWSTFFGGMADTIGLDRSGTYDQRQQWGHAEISLRPYPGTIAPLWDTV